MQKSGGLDRQDHAGNAPKDVHIHHQAHPQLGEGNLDHHRQGALKKFVEIRLEYPFVIVQQAHAGQGDAHPQDQDFKPPHQELEIQNEIDDDKHQAENRRYQPHGGDARHPARPVKGGRGTDGLQQLSAHILYNGGHPAVQGREADGNRHGLEKVCQQGKGFLIGVPVAPEDVGFKPFFQELQNDQGHAEAKQNVKQGLEQIDPRQGGHILLRIQRQRDNIGQKGVDVGDGAV